MFDFQPHLLGDLIEMRPSTAADRDALFAVAGDPEVWAMHPRGDRYKPEVFGPFFQEGLDSGGMLTAICRDSGAVAGSSRYSDSFTQPGEIEIGWTYLGRAYWGGAYNADMKRVMLLHAFRFVDRVVLRIGDTNLRSRRAAEKIGARLIDRVQVTGEGAAAQTNLYYAIERAEYLADLGAS